MDVRSRRLQQNDSEDSLNLPMKYLSESELQENIDRGITSAELDFQRVLCIATGSKFPCYLSWEHSNLFETKIISSLCQQTMADDEIPVLGRRSKKKET